MSLSHLLCILTTWLKEGETTYSFADLLVEKKLFCTSFPFS